jgi:hypothetical protein
MTAKSVLRSSHKFVFVKRNRARPDFTPRFADPQKMRFKPFKSFNRYAPFKSLNITESVPVVQVGTFQ